MFVEGIMGYAQKYFGEDNISESDVTRFISQQTPESLTLEYTAFPANVNWDDISKEISAFANSEGGLLLLGISQNNATHLPTSISWGDINQYPKEKVENSLISRVRPAVRDMRILQIKGVGQDVIYFFDVPQGDNPPYMAGDKKYHKRINFQVIDMEHFEVADYFGRRKRPKLELIPRATVFRDRALWLSFAVKNTGKDRAKEVFFRMSAKNAIVSNVAPCFEKEDEATFNFYLPRSVTAAPIFPHPSLETNLGEVILKVLDPSVNVVIFTYDLMAENMPNVGGKFIVVLQSQSKASPLIVKHDTTVLED